MEHLALPEGEPNAAVLVLSGSSGRLESSRAELLAKHGAAALALQWFGCQGQPPGICEVPLETFDEALTRLATLSDHVVVLGVSKGAEAALLLAVHDPRITAVAALSPTSVVWANVGPGLDGSMSPYRSSWTHHGRPLPFLPYDDEWVASPAFRSLYEQSLSRFADQVAAAAIPLEQTAARVLLTCGGDDQMWPSDLFAQQLAARRPEGTTIVGLTEAGHRLLLPGEEPAASAQVHGGSPEADRALGELAWPHLLDLLHIR